MARFIIVVVLTHWSILIFASSTCNADNSTAPAQGVNIAVPNDFQFDCVAAHCFAVASSQFQAVDLSFSEALAFSEFFAKVRGIRNIVLVVCQCLQFNCSAYLVHCYSRMPSVIPSAEPSSAPSSKPSSQVRIVTLLEGERYQPCHSFAWDVMTFTKH